LSPETLNLPLQAADKTNMSQRREPRFRIEQSLWITLFGEPEIHLPARVKNVSPRGIGLELQGPVAVGSALKLELDDTLLLGEVIYCRDDGASFYVGVELEHMLCGLEDLAKTLREYDNPASGLEQADTVKYRGNQNQQ
jgi:hypothetical protein